jgi:fucose 4-O-acetylase-like acetyltransferase
LNIAFSAVFFYALGSVLKGAGLFLRWKTLPLVVQLAILTLCALVFATCVYSNGRVDMSSRHYGQYILYLLGGTAGVLLLVGTLMGLEQVFRWNRTVEYFSSNTIVIMAFHLMVISALQILLAKVIDLAHASAGVRLLLGFGATLAVFGCMPAVIFIMNRYFPVAVGKKQPKVLSRSHHKKYL